jgi:hypothetical protein
MSDHIWTDAQFDEMSWHDNPVHGLRIVEGPYEAGELILDLDYILEWIKDEEGFRFRTPPTHLRFREGTNLRMSHGLCDPDGRPGAVFPPCD